MSFNKNELIVLEGAILEYTGSMGNLVPERLQALEQALTNGATYQRILNVLESIRLSSQNG